MLDGDNDQRLRGRFTLSLLAETNGAPTMAQCLGSLAGSKCRRGAVDFVKRAGETLELACQRALDVSARGRRLATIE
jgi:hypothetical protein